MSYFSNLIGSLPHPFVEVVIDAVKGVNSLVFFAWIVIQWPHNLGTLMAGLDYSEEVHQSRIEGECCNMIGYNIGSSVAIVYTTTKTSMKENLKPPK